MSESVSQQASDSRVCCHPERRSPQRPQSKDLRFGLRPSLALCTLMFGFAFVSAAYAQSDSPSRSILKGAAVEYLYPEQVRVPASKPITVTLHFRIAPGLHINSNKPHEDYLIPTTFIIPEASGVRLDAATYPAGSDITLPLDPTEKLSVYTGEFSIEARIVSAPGDRLVEAKLHYQACDKNACMPPKTITVPIDVIGK
jgi:Disulphide bond corrector protein DsbC